MSSAIPGEATKEADAAPAGADAKADLQDGYGEIAVGVDGRGAYVVISETVFRSDAAADAFCRRLGVVCLAAFPEAAAADEPPPRKRKTAKIEIKPGSFAARVLDVVKARRAEGLADAVDAVGIADALDAHTQVVAMALARLRKAGALK